MNKKVIVMLKIKDNVALKELQKYGFRELSLYGEKIYIKKCICCGEGVEIDIREDKSIDFYWGYYTIRGEEQKRFMQDLIKADLVEKVESDE